ncbi:PAAR domain-containing protein [Enterobacteriaceae bacterium LUAb1]
MSGLICLGDATTHGGVVISASSTLYIDGHQVAMVMDWVSCPRHGASQILEGDQTIQEEGRQVALNNALCGCGCRVISSHPDVSVES